MSKTPKDRTTEEGLAEIYGTGGHTRGLEDMARAVDRFKGIIPPAREQRAQSMADTRGALLALHGELYAPGVTPEAGGRARRFVLPVFTGATAALAVLAAILVYFLFVAGPKLPTVATIRVDAGSVTVVAEDGSRRDVCATSELKKGDTVSSGKDTLAELLFDNGSVTRIDRDTTILLDSSDDTATDVVLTRGQCYSQAAAENTITVSTADSDSRTAGGAFNVSVATEGTDTEGTEVVSTRTGSAVFYGPDEIQWVREGHLATVWQWDRVFKASVRDVTIEELSSPWYRFNLAMDRREGLDPGILDDLPEEDVIEVMEQMVPPEEIHPEDLPTEEPEPEPEPGPEPEPEPGPEPEPEPGPEPEPEQPSSVSTQASSVTANSVTLSWSYTGGSSCNGFSILRSQGELAPIYPANVIANLSGLSATSYQDTAVAQGQTYHYRVALMQDGSVKSYSNAVTVTVPVPPPPASLTLSGGRDPVMINTVDLSWTSTGLSGVDHWVVTRSESGGSDVSWSVPYSGSSGNYSDTSASSTLSYTYRVAAMSGGQVLHNSNTIAIPFVP